MHESEQFKFKGVFIPAEILILLQRGEISAREVMALSLIDALSPHGGEGCWASNKYLTKLLGITERPLQAMLRRLAGKKLLTIKHAHQPQRRFLQVSWAFSEHLPGCSKQRGSPAVSSGGRSCSLRSREHSLEEEIDSTGQRVLKIRGDEMPATFGRNQAETRTLSVTQFDIDTAETLHTIVTTTLQRRGSWSRKRWSERIATLRRELTTNQEARIQSTLEWYAKHAMAAGVPRVSSADSFAKVFSWLEELKLKATPFAGIAITPAAREIGVAVLAVGWSKVSDDVVLSAIAASLQNYEALLSELQKIARRKAKSYDAMLSLAKHLYDTSPAPNHFTRQWMLAVAKDVKNWAAWDGDLKRHVFTKFHRKSLAKLRQTAMAAGYEAKTTTALLEALGYEGDNV